MKAKRTIRSIVHLMGVSFYKFLELNFLWSWYQVYTRDKKNSRLSSVHLCHSSIPESCIWVLFPPLGDNNFIMVCFNCISYTVCLKSLDTFFIVFFNIKKIKSSWTYSKYMIIWLIYIFFSDWSNCIFLLTFYLL